ncbi:MAG: sensor histidine kinase [Bacteroidota bacterium]
MRYSKIILKLDIALFVLALLLCSCNDKKNNSVVYKETPNTSLDATCKWLSNDKNYRTARYIDVFYEYYNDKIKHSDYGNAAKALEIVSKKNTDLRVFDTRFLNTLIDFDIYYKSKIPPIKTFFLNTYLGDYQVDLGNFKKAITHYNKSTLLTPVDFISCREKAMTYFNISYCYFSMGNQDRALKNNFIALDYLNKIDAKGYKNFIYSNFTIIYISTKNYPEALKSNKIALNICQETKDTTNTFYNLQDKISIYTESKNPGLNALVDSTYRLFKKSKLNDTPIKTIIYTLYVRKALAVNQLVEAKAILDELKPEVVALNSINATQQYELALAEYEIKKNKTTVNDAIITNAIPVLVENRDYYKVIDFYNVLKADAIAKGNYKNALLYEQELRKADDSLASDAIKNKVLELDKKYKTEKNEKQIAYQGKTILKNNATISTLIKLFTGLLLTIIIFIFIQRTRKLKFDKQKAQLYTKQLIQKTEDERKRIATDLHDSIGHDLLNLKNSIIENPNGVNTKIDSIINDIRNISRNLHPVMFDKVGLKSSIEQLVERVQKVNNFMVSSDIQYNESLDSKEELQVYRIIQEALSNIIKYSNAVAAKITITESDTILIEIKDNGHGFDVENTLDGTIAFGLHNIIERSRAIGGIAKIESSKNGTIITVEIKKQ